jgi:hypothetical protein
MLNLIIKKIEGNMSLKRADFMKFLYGCIDEFYDACISDIHMNDIKAKSVTLKIINLMLAKYEYINGFIKLFSYPFFIKFDPSNACQLKCWGCVHSDSYKGHYWGNHILKWDVFILLW